MYNMYIVQESNIIHRERKLEMLRNAVVWCSPTENMYKHSPASKEIGTAAPVEYNSAMISDFMDMDIPGPPSDQELDTIQAKETHVIKYKSRESFFISPLLAPLTQATPTPSINSGGGSTLKSCPSSAFISER